MGDITLPINRRFDSIATLIQADGQDCGAACFDKKNLILATNHQVPQNKQLIDLIMVYMCELAQAGKKLQLELEKSQREKFHKEERKEIYTQLDAQFKDAVSEITGLAKKLPFHQESASHRENFSRALEKLRRSLILAYINPTHKQAWSVELADAIADNRIKFIAGEKGVHAELKIMQHLYDNKKIKPDRKYYVGISKRCCFNCEHVITAINNVEKTNIIEVRDDGHQGKYPAAIPKFLRHNKNLQKEFKALTQVDVEKAFYHVTHEKPKTSQQHSESDDSSSGLFDSEKKSAMTPPKHVLTSSTSSANKSNENQKKLMVNAWLNTKNPYACLADENDVTVAALSPRRKSA